MLRKLQAKYMGSKYYEIIPMNRAIRAMQEKVAEWDSAFADFDADYFPSEKDIRRLAALQLRNLFLDRDASTSSLISHDVSEHASDVDEKHSDEAAGSFESSTDISPTDLHETLESVAEEGVHEPDDVAAAAEPTFIVEEKPADAEPAPIDTPHSVVAEIEKKTLNSEPIPCTRAEDEKPAISAEDIGPSGEVELPVEKTSTGDLSLSAKIQQLRKCSQADAGEGSRNSSDVSGIPRPTERGLPRHSGVTSPPLSRNHSQAPLTIRRMQTAPMKTPMLRGLDKQESTDDSESITSTFGFGEPMKERKLSERLGLGSLKNSRKSGQSFIPRSVQTNRRDSKVSTLAKHFEQLSREFEKERMRDRKQRAAKVTQSRAFPKASSKPIVEVYKDVNEAVEERNPSDEDINGIEQVRPSKEAGTAIEGLARTVSPPSETPRTVTEPTTAESSVEIVSPAKDDENQNHRSEERRVGKECPV